MSVIEVKDLKFSYDKVTPTINGVSFSIEEGSYTSIIGHNGSGKSTIAKLLIGLLARDSGDVEICGMDLTLENLYEIRNRIGVVFQNPDNQFIGSTVADDIAFGLENHQVPTEKMQHIIDKYSKEVGMDGFLDKEPTSLSGGQKQRVAIAGVLAMNLDIIILDEATSMLDPKGKREINNLVDELHQDTNMTIISITHDIEEVSKSDQVIVLDQGNIRMAGIPEEILKHEKELIDMQLDVPFAYKMKSALKRQGITINDGISLEGMAEELCRLK